MKILHVFKTAHPFTQGGLEESIRQIALNTAGRAEAIDVACIAPPGAEGTYHHDYARLFAYRPDWRVSTCPVAVRLIPFLRRAQHSYDIIHLHAPWPFAEMAQALSPGGRARCVVTYHADIVNREPLASLYRPLLRRMLDRCDSVVATSQAYIESSPVLCRLKRRPSVIPLGIDPGSYPSPDPARVAHWRARLGTGFFLFLGVLRYYKGLDVLAAASRDLPVPTVVVGDGPEAPRLDRLAVDEKNLVRTGYLPDGDKMALLHLARAVVLPSTQRAEAFGLALLEGAMAGRALISTRLGTGTNTVNQHEVTGLVVPPGDPAALAGAMARLHRHPGDAAAFGDAARARFETCYTGRTMGMAYADLYESLLKGVSPFT